MYINIITFARDNYIGYNEREGNFKEDIIMITGAIKLVSSALIGTGIGLITNHIDMVVTPENATRLAKVCVKVATLGVGMTVAYKTQEYINEVVDETADSMKEIKEQLKTNRIFKKKTV